MSMNNSHPHQTNVERDLVVTNLGGHLCSLRTLAKCTLESAQRAETCSREIQQEGLANKLAALEYQIVEIQKMINDSEIQEWTGPEMHVPF